MRRICFIALWLVATLTLSWVPILGQKTYVSAHSRPVPVPVDAFVGAPTIAFSNRSNEASLSPDGQLLAYMVRDQSLIRRKTNRLITETGVPVAFEANALWLTNTSTGKSKRLASPSTTAWGPVWSEDGKMLAFFSDQSGQVALWIWTRERDELRQVPDVRPAMNNSASSRIGWLDSTRIVMMVKREHQTPPVLTSETAVESKEIRVYDWPPATKGNDSEKKTTKSMPSLTVAVFSSDIAIVDTSSGKTRRLSIADDLPGDFLLSPDRTTLAIALLRSRSEEQGYSDYEIASIDLRNGNRTTITSGVRTLIAAPMMSWSSGGEYLAYLSETSGYRNVGVGDCHVWSARERRIRTLSAGATERYFGRASTPPVWSSQNRVYALSVSSGIKGAIWEMTADGSKAAAPLPLPGVTVKALIPVTTANGRKPDNLAPDFLVSGFEGSSAQAVVFGYSARGGWTQLWQGPLQFGSAGGFHRGFAFADASSAVAFLREGSDQPPEFWYASQLGADPRQITNINPALKGYSFGTQKVVSFTNDWGVQLSMTLLLPPGFDSARRYPTIVMAYPNSLNQGINSFGLGISWGLNGQLLATRGYIVAYVDCPIRQNAETTMKDIAGNIVPAVQTLIKAGIADSKRIGVAGHSRGGFMVMALLVQTDIFAAALSVEPSTVSLPASAGEFGQGIVTGSGYAQTMWIEGNLWDNTAAWIENSPFFYLPRVTTPVFVVAGGDSRAIVGDQIYAGLAQLNKRVTYARYFGEGHVPSLWKSSNYRDFIERSIAWFDDHLKKPEDKKPTSEQKPN